MRLMKQDESTDRTEGWMSWKGWIKGKPGLDSDKGYPDLFTARLQGFPFPQLLCLHWSSELQLKVSRLGIRAAWVWWFHPVTSPLGSTQREGPSPRHLPYPPPPFSTGQNPAVLLPHSPGRIWINPLKLWISPSGQVGEFWDLCVL